MISVLVYISYIGVGFSLSVLYNGQCESLGLWNDDGRIPRFLFVSIQPCLLSHSREFLCTKLIRMDKNRPNLELLSNRGVFKRVPKTALQIANVAMLTCILACAVSCNTTKSIGQPTTTMPVLEDEPLPVTAITPHIINIDTIPSEIVLPIDTIMESSQDTPRGQIEFQDTITLRQKKIVNVTADTTTFPYNKIAQINSDELIRRLPEYNLIRDSIVQYQTNLQRQLELMRNYINQEVSYIIAHKDNLSPAMNYFYQTEVSQLPKLVDLYERIILQEEYTYEVALMQPLKEKIKNAVKVVAERNGFLCLSPNVSS